MKNVLKRFVRVLPVKRFARVLPVKRFVRMHPVSRFAATVSLAVLSMLVISLVQAHPASAANVLACPPTNLGFNSIPNTFCIATGDWLMRAQNIAKGFFFSLVAVEMAWSMILYVLQKDNLGELLTSWLLKIMGICFFYAVILNANIWLPAILNSFIQLGNQVTAQNVALDPENIFETGLAFCNAVFSNLPQAQFPGWEAGPTVFNPNISGTIVDNLTVVFEMFVSVVFAAIVCLIIFAAFVVVAGQLLMTLIEAYIMISAGAVMLGFMGSRWTMSWGEKYIGYAISIGIKLFVTFVILGLGSTLFGTWYTLLGAIHGIVFDGPNTISLLSTLVQDYLSIGAAAIVYLMLVIKLPGLASSMLNGSPSLSFGGAAGTAAAVAGAVTGIAAGVANAVGGALSKAGGAASALKDASAVEDKIDALAAEGAVDALGDAAGAGTDDAFDGLGDGVAEALGDGPVDLPGDESGVGGTTGEALGDGPVDLPADDDASRELADDISEDEPLLGAQGSDSQGQGTLAVDDQRSATGAESDARKDGSLVNVATSTSGGGGQDSALSKAIREAAETSNKAKESGLQRELAHAGTAAGKEAFGAIGSLANGAARSASSATRLLTDLDEGNGGGGSAQISLRLPD
jgi:type IV secretion system protein TrbL